MKNDFCKNLMSFLPCMYMYFTRLGTPFRFFQFFGGELLPMIVMTYLSLNNGSILALFNVEFAFFVSLSLFVYFTFFTLYEIGYVINDCVTTKYESRPTLRYNKCDYWRYLVFSKILLFIFLTLFASVTFRVNIFAIFFYAAVTLLIFMAHNGLSVQDRSVTYFWLQFMRLMILPYTVIHDIYALLIMILLVFPELFRRGVRYMRIKYLSQDRKFSTFDLKASLISTFLVGIFICKFAFHLVPALIIGYAIIIAGIIISILLRA